MLKVRRCDEQTEQQVILVPGQRRDWRPCQPISWERTGRRHQSRAAAVFVWALIQTDSSVISGRSTLGHRGQTGRVSPLPGKDFPSLLCRYSSRKYTVSWIPGRVEAEKDRVSVRRRLKTSVFLLEWLRLVGRRFWSGHKNACAHLPWTFLSALCVDVATLYPRKIQDHDRIDYVFG